MPLTAFALAVAIFGEEINEKKRRTKEKNKE
jgi:hypothetical protein